MKINIAIPFNDIVPPRNIGMVPGKKPPYYQQLIYLIKSIKKNWDSNVLDYSIHVFHSRALSDEKKNQLESLGCEVIHDPYEFIPYLCRESVFKYEMDGEYTLLLDTDMVVLKTPVFEYEKDVYARKAGSQSVTNITESDILSLEVTMGSPSNKYIHFNGGCVLIRNSIKNEFHKKK